VVTKDVPQHCTVVGIPGRVVRREGVPVVKIDLRHDELPDPLRDAISNISSKISEVERRLSLLEEQLKKQK
jgi:serine O-acetyltransferase